MAKAAAAKMAWHGENEESQRRNESVSVNNWRENQQ